MRKMVIWILTIAMFIAFCGLLYMQFTYFRKTIRLRTDQFDQAVSHSLYQTAMRLENEQVMQYLKKGIDNAKQNAEEKKTDAAALTNNELEMSEAFRLQEVVKQRYEYQRKIIDQVLYDLVNKPASMPFDQRVSFTDLHEYLHTELQNNGMDMPCYIRVMKKNEEVVMQDSLYDPSKNEKIYSQVLFPNDQIDRLTFMDIYFPDRQGYLYNDLYFVVPSIVFIIILLITFAVAIYLILKQKRLSDMKTDFVNNMTHELKTPVASISLAAQMLQDSSVKKSPESIKHITQVIVDETKRLRLQVEKVLQMSLFERQTAVLRMLDKQLDDIIRCVSNTSRLKVEQLGGVIELDLKASENTIKADEVHFTNVLFNLLDNAMKYRRKEVPLHLRIKTWNNPAETRVFVSLEDNGIGIKKEHLRKIFIRFYRVPTGNKHNAKGFGLGLAYVNKIVSQHNGTIRVESETEKGTTFIINLPTVKK
jgi:signal transduction histidine kinase